MLQGLHECDPYGLAMSPNFANAACLRPNGKYLAPIVATDRWNRQSPKLDVHSREPSASVSLQMQAARSAGNTARHMSIS